MNMKSILEKTVSYEEWVIERLQDKQEVDLYIEACLDVFREDGDLDGLLSALELVLRAQNRDNLHPLRPVVGLSFPYASLADLPYSDDLPKVQLDGWPTTAPEETLSHSYQPNPVGPFPPPQFFFRPSGLSEGEWDNTVIAMSEMQYLSAETLLGVSTWGTSVLEKGKTLERE